MPLRDYEFTQQTRKTGELKISIKGLTRALECDPVECQGFCCSHFTDSRFSTHHPDELEKLPQNLRHLVNRNGTTKVFNKRCPLISHCIKDPSIIPTECRLFPLGFNSAGRLILKRWAWVKPCPAYNKGRPIYVAMKQCLIDIFGEEV